VQRRASNSGILMVCGQKITLGRLPSGPGCRASRSTASGTAHNNVAFTLTRYGGLFEDGSEEAESRLDVLLGGPAEPRERVLPLKRGERL
jgi:hypothetical protein